MKNGTRSLLILLTITLLTGLSARAQTAPIDIILGSEIEFGNAEMVKLTSPRGLINMTWADWKSLIQERYIYPGEAETKYVKKFAKAVKLACGEDCTVLPVKGKFDTLDSFEVRFKNGFWFQITRDASVVEILGFRKLSEWKKFESMAQKYIFDIAQQVGLTPGGSQSRFSVGASHINIGVWDAFGNDGLKFLRYFVDRANEPEFAMGLFLKDYINAPPMTKLKEEQRQALQDIILQVEKDPQAYRPADVASLILKKVYTSSPYIGTEPEHYQVFSVKSVPKASGPDHDKPMEHRDQRVQQNIHEFILAGELFAKRIAYLNQQTTPIIYSDKATGSFTKQELVNRLYVYTAEMGESFNDYSALLPDELRGVSPDPFVLGRLNWQDSDAYEQVSKHLIDLWTSPFIRDRFFQALAKAPASARILVSTLLQEVQEIMQHQNLPARKNVEVALLLKRLDAHPKFTGTGVLSDRLERQIPVSQRQNAAVYGVLTCSKVLLN